jgi:D-alanyl-D-alanine carboxypeptidase (penicillin-binding protein 5/6)
MPVLPNLLQRRRSTLVVAVAGVAVATGAAVLFIPGPAAQATGLIQMPAGRSYQGSSATGTDSAAPADSSSASASAAASSTAGSATFLGPATLSISAQATVPGTSTLAFPTQGQARIDIDGLSTTSSYGPLGSYGPVNTAAPIASVTKTMTAYQILRDHPLAPGDQGPSITLTSADVTAYNYDLSQNMSTVPVKAGEQITENQALQALMLASANNMADILAHWDTASTADTAFVARMNATAASLGMANTHYVDTSGYEPGSVSTVTDQIKLGRLAMLMPYFAGLVKQTSAVIPVAGTITNYNSLLGADGIDGIKTGSTDEAGGCLLFHATVTIGGRRLGLTGAILGQLAPNGTELSVGLAAAKALVASAEAEITTRTLIPATTAVATMPMTDGTTTALHPVHDFTITAWPGEAVTLRIAGFRTTPVLQAYTSDGKLLGTVALH